MILGTLNDLENVDLPEYSRDRAWASLCHNATLPVLPRQCLCLSLYTLQGCNLK